MLRKLGCTLPIQLWHLGPKEFDPEMAALVQPLQVECIDAEQTRKEHPARLLQGWELKPYAILHSPYQEVLLLDADNVPVRNPEFLFTTKEYQETGAVFWPDFGKYKPSELAWSIFDVPYRDEPDFESGQILVDKAKCWRALCLSMWYNENSDFYYQYVHGDKETFHLAFRKLGQPYAMPSTPIHPLPGTMCQHDFEGQRLFQHRNMDKWDLFPRNIRTNDFWYESECFQYLEALRQTWDGRCRSHLPRSEGFSGLRPAVTLAPLRIKAWMISCQEREKVRVQTLDALYRTDWPREMVEVQLDAGSLSCRKARQTETAYLALARAVQEEIDYLLFLEDDLEFNRFFYQNLEAWAPLRNRVVTLGGLYNPGVEELAADVKNHAFVANPFSIFGSQAFLIARDAARYFLDHWDSIAGMQDIKFSRLAEEMKLPVFYHVPSLVQHVGQESSWGGKFHQAYDFDPTWRSEDQA